MRFGQLSQRQALLAGLTIGLLMIVVLESMGQPWWCQCGSLVLWTSDALSSHNSQHLLDPYSFSHFQHGLVFYYALWFFTRDRLSLWSRATLMFGLEAVWEVFENTPWTIERYRAATISLDYYGDSVFNSLGDLASCALGFAFAAAVPVWGSLTVYLMVEIGMLWLIRDSLLLNIVMLICPLDVIKDWQQGV